MRYWRANESVNKDVVAIDVPLVEPTSAPIRRVKPGTVRPAVPQSTKKPEVSLTQIETLHLGICRNCPYFSGQRRYDQTRFGCRKCGCSGKWLSDEECPDGRWDTRPRFYDVSEANLNGLGSRDEFASLKDQ